MRIRIYANLVSLVLVQPQLEKIALPQIRWVLLSDFAGDRTLSSCQEAIWSAVLEEVQRDAEVGLVCSMYYDTHFQFDVCFKGCLSCVSSAYFGVDNCSLPYWSYLVIILYCKLSCRPTKKPLLSPQRTRIVLFVFDVRTEKVESFQTREDMILP